ncbi:hypothetical protein Tco_0906424 [Tanacetum coccineum]|uniref:Uncharacterized protein n=1 Tax=Tanacetum coccineum TaxID=301880 RepID=A0ABQ5CHL5_9ASTR
MVVAAMSVASVLTTPIPKNGENATVEQIKSGRGPSGTMMTMSAEAKYMAEDASSKKFLVSKFTNYKMTDSRPVMEQYNELVGILGRFSQLINDMHTIGMTMQQVQVNTKFLNALPSEWSKFVTDVKLAKSLYATNYDQLYAYLSQHKRHAIEVRIMGERYPDPLAFVANSLTLYNPSQSPQHS